jgi:carboxyl-terminal processing protease
MFNRVKNKIAFFLVITIGIFTYSFSENFFEISKQLDIFSTLFRELNLNYVDETEPGQLMKTAIDEMLSSLDPYTNYISESDIEDYKMMTTGEYGGIGALIRNQDNQVLISEPYEKFPAQKNDIRAGDIILEIDGKKTEGKESSAVSDLLKGQPGTELKLKIKRPVTNEILEKVLKREVIKIDNVPYYGMVDKEIGYIRLNSFTETASKEVKDAFIELKEKQGMKKLILDLRGNGGGLLREAVNIVNFFIEKGEDVVATKGKIPDANKVMKALNAPLDKEMPIVVLIDNGSASASEIVAGAIQDLDRGVVIGQRSFGKGLVQQTRPLSYNAQLKVTVAKYYTPSGRCIQKIDYSNKDEKGKAKEVADSLKTAFKTKNGRLVYDGTGVNPDIEIKPESFSAISTVLVSKSLLFDYATYYRNKKNSIQSINDFQINEADYVEFKKWLSDKDYNYNTKSEESLKALEKMAIEDKYFDDLKNEFQQLEKKIITNKAEDLETFKLEIIRLLENEIISRYYFQKGRIIHALKQDEDLKEAKFILNSNTEYKKIFNSVYLPQKK